MCVSRFCLLGLMVLSTGCDLLDKAKSDNPVVGPPPPRMKLSEASDADTPTPLSGNARIAEAFPRRAQNDQSDNVVTVAGQSPQDDEFVDSTVVATVNGNPVFAYEVLEPYAERLAEIVKKYPPATVREFRQQAIRKDLKDHISQKLLCEAFRKSLTKEQREMFDKHLADAFTKTKVAQFQTQFGVSTEHEVELKLKERGTSLAMQKRMFESQQMSREYLRSQIQKEREIGRPELLAYYQAHAEEYNIASRAKWQEIKVDFARHGGRDGAIDVLEKAVAELQRGVGFNDVAKKYSDGPTAAAGGSWDWTQQGSLADTTVDQALFNVPVGGISAIIDGKDGFVLVKVIERQQAGRVPLADVQDKIKKKITDESRHRSVEEAIEKLRADALIEIHDNEHIQAASG